MKKLQETITELNDKLKNKTPEEQDEEFEQFYECIKDIATHPVVLRMKLYPHHGVTNCYQHCLHVSYYNYIWCKALGLDARSAARAGMLHDLFLYDWHTHAKQTGDRFHGMTHPKRALKNAEKFFDLNKIERDVIINHMWPVTLFSVPRTKEGWITTLADKYCGSFETAQRKESDSKKKSRRMDRIVERFSYLVDTKR